MRQDRETGTHIPGFGKVFQESYSADKGMHTESTQERAPLKLSRLRRLVLHRPRRLTGKEDAADM